MIAIEPFFRDFVKREKFLWNVPLACYLYTFDISSFDNFSI